ncbi:MAG: hypothetical protein AAGI36_16565, partial [Pseudomonadota bacterium]
PSKLNPRRAVPAFGADGADAFVYGVIHILHGPRGPALREMSPAHKENAKADRHGGQKYGTCPRHGRSIPPTERSDKCAALRQPPHQMPGLIEAGHFPFRTPWRPASPRPNPGAN